MVISPEQARGEGHRVDGRADIFSLGVLFYELLTGRRPFSSKAEDIDEALHQLLDLIVTTEARPPRQLDDTIPKELERVCLKAMSKRASDRYTTGRDMAEDLQAFLRTFRGAVIPAALAVPVSPPPDSKDQMTPVPSTSQRSDSDQRPMRIVPKGLRSFFNTTPISSSNCSGALVTGTGCPTACGSGRLVSKKRMPTTHLRSASLILFGRHKGDPSTQIVRLRLQHLFRVEFDTKTVRLRMVCRTLHNSRVFPRNDRNFVAA